MKIILIQDSISTQILKLVQLSLSSQEIEQYELITEDCDNVLSTVQYLLSSLIYVDVCIVMGMKNVEYANSLLNSLVDPDMMAMVNISFIILTDFCSWSRSNIVISPDMSQSFALRQAPATQSIIYEFENRMWQYSQYYGFKLRILATGLLYGGEGYDFSGVLDVIWKQDMLHLPMNHSSILPMIHYQDFMNTFRQIVFNEIIAKDSNSLHMVIPIIDNNPHTVGEIMTTLTKFYNNSDNKITYNSYDASDKYASGNWKCNIIVSHEDQIAKLTFIDDYPCTVLEEYLPIRNYRNLSFAVLGGPLYGKTLLSKKISERFKVLYLTIPFAVRFIMEWKPVQLLNKHICPCAWSADDILSLATEIEGLIRLKLSEGKKIKKNDEPIEVDISLLDLSGSFCKGFSAEILKRTLKAVLCNNLNAVRYGYVLDVYDYDLLNTANDLLSIIPNPQFLVDINLDSTIATKRFITGLGVDANSKLSKEHAASFKAFEQKVAAYKSKQVASGGALLNSISVELHSLGVIANIVQIDGVLATELSIDRIQLLICGDREVASSNESFIAEEAITSIVTTSQPNTSVDKAQDAALKVSLIELEEFVITTVLPSIADGMIQIHRQKPFDPIRFMSQHLQQKSEAQTNSAESEAYANFRRLLEREITQ